MKCEDKLNEFVCEGEKDHQQGNLGVLPHFIMIEINGELTQVQWLRFSEDPDNKNGN